MAFDLHKFILPDRTGEIKSNRLRFRRLKVATLEGAAESPAKRHRGLPSVQPLPPDKQDLHPSLKIL
jgi:hypothetical protein